MLIALLLVVWQVVAHALDATTSIPITALPSPDDVEVRRDRWGRYLVLPPDGAKPVGYTRATTVAGTLDDTFALGPWKAAMTVTGMMRMRGLRAKWEVLLAQYRGDPWYASDESKKACKALVEECCAAGGANDRSEIGTSLHKVTELIDRGLPVPHLSDETQRDVDAYTAALDSAGITVAPEMIERMVVLDDHRVAGMFDRGLIVPSFERLVIGDLKTGSNLDHSYQSIATQLAIYSRADALYTQGSADDGSEDAREPMPAFDQDNGLIIWLPAGTGECHLILVDLTAGAEAFQRSMWAREWRETKVTMPFGEGRFGRGDADLVPTLEASVAAAQHEAPPPTEPPPAEGTYIGWLQGRIDVIGRHPEGRSDLARSWPEGVPPLRSSTEHTPAQLAAIENVIGDVERRHQMLFPPPRPDQSPTNAAMVRAMRTFPGSTPTKDTP